MDCRLIASHVNITQASLTEDLREVYSVTGDGGGLIYLAYVKEKQAVFIAPIQNEWFVKVYAKAKQVMLKQCNLAGDFSFSVRDILIDENLDFTDRVLKTKFIEGKLIQMNL